MRHVLRFFSRTKLLNGTEDQKHQKHQKHQKLPSDGGNSAPRKDLGVEKESAQPEDQERRGLL